MKASTPDTKLELIRGYLEKQLSACVIQEGILANGQVPLLVAHGMTRASARCRSVERYCRILTSMSWNCAGH